MIVGTRATPLEAYKMYIATRQHFTNKKYDLFADGVKIRGTQAQLDERNDRHYYYAMSDEYLVGDLADFYMANILDGRRHPSEFEDVIWREWVAKIQSLAYTFECDLKFLTGLGHGFKPLFSTTNGSMPIALQAMNGGHISIETICLVDKLTNGAIMAQFDNQITDVFVWEPLRLKIVKYQPWIRTNLDVLNKILVRFTGQ